MNPRALAILLVWTAPTLLCAQEERPKLEVRIKYVDPDTVALLPSWLRAALAQRGCLIPQIHSDNTVNNIHRGNLVHGATESYALLCSRDSQSAVLVLTPDSTLAPPPILLQPDTSFLVIVGGGSGPARWEFARYLTVLGRAEVRDWCRPSTLAEVHDGVITFYQDRDATAYYWDATKGWIRCSVPGEH